MKKIKVTWAALPLMVTGLLLAQVAQALSADLTLDESAPVPFAVDWSAKTATGASRNLSRRARPTAKGLL